MTTDALADHYLRAAGLHAVIVTGSPDCQAFRIDAATSAKRTRPKGCAASGGWWCPDEILARRLVDFAYSLSDARGVTRSRRWIGWPAASAADLVALSAAQLGMKIWTDAELRPQAVAACEEIEREMEARRQSGGLKSINREYQAQRQAMGATGKRMPTYGDYMLRMKIRLVEERGLRDGLCSKGAF